MSVSISAPSAGGKYTTIEAFAGIRNYYLLLAKKYMNSDKYCIICNIFVKSIVFVFGDVFSKCASLVSITLSFETLFTA